MASLVSISQIASLTGQLGNHFDTFSGLITIFKEPQKTFSNSNANVYAGYGPTSQETTVTYTPTSGMFAGIIIYPKTAKIGYFSEAQIPIQQGNIRIKVRQDAKDYIKNGKTEKIVIDGASYNLASDFSVQNYLGLIYYYFDLERTN